MLIDNHNSIRSKFIAIVLACASIIMTVCMFRDNGTILHYHYDDAYITYRYAANLSSYGELAYNCGERVDAASSFLYTVVLAASHRIGLRDIERTSGILNLLSIGCIAYFVFMSILVVTRNELMAVLFSLSSSLHGFVSGWATVGMDTVPFAALLVAFVYYTTINRRDIVSLLLICAVVLMRPEGIMAIPVWLVVNKRNGAHILLILSATLLYFWFKYIYYGTIIPNSYSAKSTISYYNTDALYTVAVWARYAIVPVILAVASVCAGTGRDRNIRVLWLFLVPSVIACLTVMRSDYMRYTLHLIPILFIVGSTAAIRRTYVVCAMAVLLLFQTASSVDWMSARLSTIKPAQVARQCAGEYIMDNVDNSVWILSSDIGGIGYYAINNKFVDGNRLVSIVSCSDVHPGYIADTFSISGNMITYNNSTEHDYVSAITPCILMLHQFSARSVISVCGIDLNQ